MLDQEWSLEKPRYLNPSSQGTKFYRKKIGKIKVLIFEIFADPTIVFTKKMSLDILVK